MRGFSTIDNRPLLSIAIVGITVTLPLILFGLPYDSDDGVAHFLYQENFALQFWEGEVYPRWLSFINGGFGGPTFFYYPPLSYYITCVFGLLPTNSWHHLGLSTSFGLILSGSAAFIWLREISGQRQAVLAAMLYMLAPYHINFDIYARGAFAEAYAFVWMPLILYFATRLVRHDQFAFFGLAVSFAALCATHLLTALMFGPVPVFYLLLRSPEATRFKTTALGLTSMFLGAGMAAVFILPALTYIDWVYLFEAREGHFDFENWLMTHTLFIKGTLKYFLMTFTVISLALLCFLLTSRETENGKRMETRIWLIVTCASVFMMTYLSYPVWMIVEPLQMVQFPWRFNTVLCVSALPLIATGFGAMRRPFTLTTKFTVGLVVFFAIVSAGDLAVKYRRKFIKPTDASQNLGRYAKLVQRQDTHTNWPLTVTYGLTPATNKFGLPDLEKTKSEFGLSDTNEIKAFATSGTVELKRVSSRILDIEARSDSAFSITVTQFHYPGWTAKYHGSDQDIPISLKSDLGLISLDLPAGDHRVALTLGKLPAEAAGEWISLASLFALGFIVLLKMRPSGNAVRESNTSFAQPGTR